MEEDAPAPQNPLTDLGGSELNNFPARGTTWRKIGRFLVGAAFALGGLFTIVGLNLASSYGSGLELTPLEEFEVMGWGVMLLITSYLFVRSTRHWESKLTCPACETKDTLRPVNFNQQRYNLFFGLGCGLTGMLLFSQARKRRLRCESCHQLVRVRTAGGWVSWLWLAFFVGSLAIALYAHCRN